MSDRDELAFNEMLMPLWMRLFQGVIGHHISIITSFADTESACVPRSARAMQDGVRLALLHFLQQLTDFRCGRRNELDTAPFRLC